MFGKVLVLQSPRRITSSFHNYTKSGKVSNCRNLPDNCSRLSTANEIAGKKALGSKTVRTKVAAPSDEVKDNDEGGAAEEVAAA